jgi:uncharacterized protein YkwD
LHEIRVQIDRLTAQVLDPEIDRTYAQWISELRGIEARGAPAEAIAASKVRGSLKETLARRPKIMVPVAAAPEPAATAAPGKPRTDVPPAGPAKPPAAEVPQPAQPPAAAATRATAFDPAVVAEADRLARLGLYAQALAIAEGALADVRDPAAVEQVRNEVERLRKTAAEALRQLVADAERAAAAGRPEEALALLSGARARFPATSDFAALPQAIATIEAAMAAAAAAAAVPTTPARAPAAAAETTQASTFAIVRSHLDAVRGAEDRGAFGEAARLLREAAGHVRDVDAAFSARLEARAEEAQALAAWHDAVANAIRSGSRLKTTTRDGRAVTLLQVEGSRMYASSFDGEERLSWNEVSAFGISTLIDQLQPAPAALLGAASLLYRLDDAARAEVVLARALGQDATLKDGIDHVIASGRGEPADPRGYTLGKDGFQSVRQIELQKEAKKLSGRLETAMRDRDPSKRDQLLSDVLAGGPEIIPVLITALQKDLQQQVEKLEAGSLKKQVERLAAQRDQLDEARDHARALIYDEEKYFYPYKPPAVSGEKYAEYNRVQAEVSRRVDALRAIWKDKRTRVRVPASLQGDLDRLDWTMRQLADLGALDRTLAARIEWARALPAGESVTLQDYCRSVVERQELEKWRRVEAYNVIVGKQASSSVREQLAITNEYRAMFRHQPLALVLSLCEAAQGHAEEMSRLGYFAHMSPTPGRQTPYERMRLAGYDSGVSENIALHDGAQGAHDAWCTSSGHHRNLLDPNHTEIGVGADGRNWVQNFGSGKVHTTDPAWHEVGASSR